MELSLLGSARALTLLSYPRDWRSPLEEKIALQCLLGWGRNRICRISAPASSGAKGHSALRRPDISLMKSLLIRITTLKIALLALFLRRINPVERIRGLIRLPQAKWPHSSNFWGSRPHLKQISSTMISRMTRQREESVRCLFPSTDIHPWSHRSKWIKGISHTTEDQHIMNTP